MKKLLILWMVLVAFASCTDRKDLFDSGRVKEEAKENFPIKDIDPDQDWNMMAVRTLDITINAGTGAVYTVKVLTDNPFKVENDAHVLAVADVKDGTTATLKFDAPSAMEYAYVMRQVGTKDCEVTVAALKDDKFVVAFGRSATQRAVSERAANITIDNLPAPGFTCPNDAEELAEKDITGHVKEGTYYISESLKIDKINLSEDTKLYIKSGITLTLNVDKIDKGTILVCKGGTLRINGTGKDDDDFTLKGSIYNEGTVTINGDDFYMQNKEAELVNYGIIYIEADFELSAGEFYNGESGQCVSYETSVDSNSTDGANENKSSATWVNDGYYACGSDGKDVIFNNSGFIHCGGKAELENAILNMAGKSIFKTQSLEFEKSVRLNSDAGVQDKDKPLLLCVNKALYDDDKGELTMSGVTYVTCGNDFFDSWAASGHVLLVNATVGDHAQGCNPDYDKEEPSTTPPLAIFTYVFEDITTTTGDYDFNDVVLKVTAVNNGQVTIALAAAGATKELSAGYKVNGRDNILWSSVHEALGVSAGTIVNPGPSTLADMPKQTIKNITSLGDIAFYIHEKNNPNLRVYISQDDPEFQLGGVPFALCIPTDWAYPAERQMINEKYEGFGAWGEDRNSHQEWYKKPTK